MLVRHHTMPEAGHHNMAKTTARGSGTHGLHHPHHLHLHWITGLRVTEAQCQLLHQCHQGLIGLGPPGICTVADVTGNQKAI